ncbi:MAG TPA: urease subunit beta [Candidatus Nitrosopolaris sp.]|nr:urease subunit beta [Candidatus Nitrosopolaris sp.]
MVSKSKTRVKSNTKPPIAKKPTGKKVSSKLIPGEYILSSNSVICNENRNTVKITVKNTGDRPSQIGSHTHFFEVNRALDFPRQKAYGYRLNIPAGTSVRFEPGDSKEVELCEIGGQRIVYGFNALTMGELSSSMVRDAAFDKAKKQGYKGA